MTTLNRLLESVFEGKRFESIHNSIPTEKVEKAIKSHHHCYTISLCCQKPTDAATKKQNTNSGYSAT